MRGYGDSGKPAGTDGYDGRSLAEEFRQLVRQIGFGNGHPLTIVAHDMGAPPALLWAADHPEEVSNLLYVEEPVLRLEFLSRLIVYTPEAAANGSMWWWLLPLAPNGPETVIVGHERAYLSWFYDRVRSSHDAVGSAIDEYARTFSGTEGVLGALGVYRAAFRTIDQTEPLATNKVTVPVTAVGGELSRGDQVREMLESVADTVTGVVIPACGHFVPEERPQQIADLVLGLTGTASRVLPFRRVPAGEPLGRTGGLQLINVGLGPAVITRAVLTLDGEPLGEFGEESVNLLRGKLSVRPAAVTFRRTILATDYDQFLLSVESFDRAEHTEFADLLKHRLGMEIRYESLYGGEGYKAERKPRPRTQAASSLWNSMVFPRKRFHLSRSMAAGSSPMSQNNPAISWRAWRASGASRCSSGACCAQAG
jgi:pimeloyl-ACP methyl ester carboxylesterase